MNTYLDLLLLKNDLFGKSSKLRELVSDPIYVENFSKYGELGREALEYLLSSKHESYYFKNNVKSLWKRRLNHRDLIKALYSVMETYLELGHNLLRFGEKGFELLKLFVEDLEYRLLHGYLYVSNHSSFKSSLKKKMNNIIEVIDEFGDPGYRAVVGGIESKESYWTYTLYSYYNIFGRGVVVEEGETGWYFKSIAKFLRYGKIGEDALRITLKGIKINGSYYSEVPNLLRIFKEKGLIQDLSADFLENLLYLGNYEIEYIVDYFNKNLTNDKSFNKFLFKYTNLFFNFFKEYFVDIKPYLYYYRQFSEDANFRVLIGLSENLNELLHFYLSKYDLFYKLQDDLDYLSCIMDEANVKISDKLHITQKEINEITRGLYVRRLKGKQAEFSRLGTLKIKKPKEGLRLVSVLKEKIKIIRHAIFSLY